MDEFSLQVFLEPGSDLEFDLLALLRKNSTRERWNLYVAQLDAKRPVRELPLRVTRLGPLVLLKLRKVKITKLGELQDYFNEASLVQAGIGRPTISRIRNELGQWGLTV